MEAGALGSPQQSLTLPSSGPSPSAPVGRGVALARSVARAARMGTQAAHAHLHEIECVERLGLNSLMRALC